MLLVMDRPEDVINQLLSANATYSTGHESRSSAVPSRRLTVITCMDARIDPLAAFGLELGDAHVLRNAGGRVTDCVLRSLAVSSHLMEVRAVAVVQHTRCGMVGVTDDALRQRTGADIDFLAIDDHASSLEQDLDRIWSTPWLGSLELAVGLVYDLDTGRLSELARRSRINP